MNKIKTALLGTMLVFSVASFANDSENRDISVRELINKYAQHHNTNFVISHKVKGRVEILGVNVEKMSKGEFIDILEYHDFVATRKDRVVYIFTRFEVEHLGKGVGPIWQG